MTAATTAPNPTYTEIFIPADSSQACRREQIPRHRSLPRVTELVGSLFPLVDSTQPDVDARFLMNGLSLPHGLPVNQRATTYLQEQLSTAAAKHRERGEALPVEYVLRGDVVVLGEVELAEGVTDLADAPERFDALFGLGGTPRTRHPPREPPTRNEVPPGGGPRQTTLRRPGRAASRSRM